MTASTDDLQVGFDIGDIDCGYSRLNNGWAVDTNKPEHGHGTIDDGYADVAIRSYKEWFEYFQDPGTKHHASRILEHHTEEPEYQYRKGERDQVGEGLRDIMRNLIRQLNGDVALHEEFIDIRNAECYDESREQAFRAHELCGDAAFHRFNCQQHQADDGDDHNRYIIDLTQFRQLVVDAVGQALGDGCYHEDSQNAHREVVSLPKYTADVIRPFVLEDFRYTGYENED